MQLITFAVITWAVLRYIRAHRLAINITGRIMQMDELIDELLETPEMPVTGSGVPASTVGVSEKDVQQHRKRLAALAVGGQAKQYGLVVKGMALRPTRLLGMRLAVLSASSTTAMACT